MNDFFLVFITLSILAKQEKHERKGWQKTSIQPKQNFLFW